MCGANNVRRVITIAHFHCGTPRPWTLCRIARGPGEDEDGRPRRPPGGAPRRAPATHPAGPAGPHIGAPRRHQRRRGQRRRGGHDPGGSTRGSTGHGRIGTPADAGAAGTRQPQQWRRATRSPARGEAGPRRCGRYETAGQRRVAGRTDSARVGRTVWALRVQQTSRSTSSWPHRR